MCYAVLTVLCYAVLCCSALCFSGVVLCVLWRAVPCSLLWCGVVPVVVWYGAAAQHMPAHYSTAQPFTAASDNTAQHNIGR